MQIHLIFFAILEDKISAEPISFEVKKNCTAEDLIDLLSQKYPHASAILKSTRLALEDEYVGKKTVLKDGEEYCLIPPVSGG